MKATILANAADLFEAIEEYTNGQGSEALSRMLVTIHQNGLTDDTRREIAKFMEACAESYAELKVPEPPAGDEEDGQ